MEDVEGLIQAAYERLEQSDRTRTVSAWLRACHSQPVVHHTEEWWVVAVWPWYVTQRRGVVVVEQAVVHDTEEGVMVVVMQAVVHDTKEGLLMVVQEMCMTQRRGGWWWWNRRLCMTQRRGWWWWI